MNIDEEVQKFFERMAEKAEAEMELMIKGTYTSSPYIGQLTEEVLEEAMVKLEDSPRTPYFIYSWAVPSVDNKAWHGDLVDKMVHESQMFPNFHPKLHKAFIVPVSCRKELESGRAINEENH